MWIFIYPPLIAAGFCVSVGINLAILPFRIGKEIYCKLKKNDRKDQNKN